MNEDPAVADTQTALEAPAPDPLLGCELDGRYRIVARLGSGGMGIVYEAQHVVLNTRLAVKVLRKEAAGDEEALERLRREAQAASAIGSDHIVDVRDVGRLEDGSTYLVMELIEGVDLYAIVRAAPIAWDRACRIALQVCDALFAAHERGIVHRDLKLENVLLTSRRGESDFVKIVDFGIAKLQGVSKKITVAGRVMGTPEYMSPEQCAGHGVDHRTDIYSLGVMLYEMVTGRLPFYDEDLTTLVRMQMQDEPPRPSSVRPDVEIPPALEAVILRCLAKHPDERFATMADVGSALRAVLGGAHGALETAPLASPLHAPPRPTPKTLRTRKASPRWMTPALGLAVTCIVAIGWIVATSRGTSEATMSATAAPPAEAEPAREEEGTRREPVAPVELPVETATSTAPLPSTITVESAPRTARVFDPEGALLGDTPLELPRPERGERITIELRSEGFETQSVMLSHLSAERVRITLARRAHGRRARPSASGAHEPAPPRSDGTTVARQNEAAATSVAAPPPSHREFLDPWAR